jgi:hypothetical protein
MFNMELNFYGSTFACDLGHIHRPSLLTMLVLPTLRKTIPDTFLRLTDVTP